MLKNSHSKGHSNENDHFHFEKSNSSAGRPILTILKIGKKMLKKPIYIPKMEKLNYFSKRVQEKFSS